MLFPCTLYYYTLRFGTIIHLNVYLHSFVTLFHFSNSLKTKIARAQLRRRRRGRVARLLSNHFPWGFLSRVCLIACIQKFEFPAKIRISRQNLNFPPKFEFPAKILARKKRRGPPTVIGCGSPPTPIHFTFQLHNLTSPVPCFFVPFQNHIIYERSMSFNIIYLPLLCHSCKIYPKFFKNPEI